MITRRLAIPFFLLTLLTCSLNANCITEWTREIISCWDFNPLHGPHRVYIGPEIFYLKRDRQGGSRQSGTMYGFHLGYDHIRKNAFYWCVDYYKARGWPTGKTGTGSHLRSIMTESQIEGRLGFTLRRHFIFCTNFTPYAGYGRFQECNDFIHPSPLHVHFRNVLDYVVVGMLAQASCTPCITVGIDGKVKFVIDAKSHISHDPENEDMSLIIGNKLQWEVELPITYSHCECPGTLGYMFVPFYRFRHYGGRENFPFDFIDTRYYSIGARFEFTYVF